MPVVAHSPAPQLPQMDPLRAPRSPSGADPGRSRSGLPPASSLPASQLFAALLQRSGSISHTEALPSTSHGSKRKLTEDLGAGFDITSPSDVVLPKDPARRASIIHLATAAAAAVLQSQLVERRFSQQEHLSKRQRTREEQLNLLAEQARLTHLTAARARNDSSEGTDGVDSSTRPSLSSTATGAELDASSSRAAGNAAHPAATTSDVDEAAEPRYGTNGGLSAIRSFSIPSDPQPSPAAHFSATKMAIDPAHQQEWEATINSEGFLDEAKEVANHYSRFYRFEQEWAHRALAIGNAWATDGRKGAAKRPSHDEDRHDTHADEQTPSPTSESGPSLGDVASNSGKDQPYTIQSLRASPRQRSPASTRPTSRAVSPSESAVERRQASGDDVDGDYRGSPMRGPSQGLASVLSNFADLVKARQESCSGLEALAQRVQVLPSAATIVAEALDGKGADGAADDDDDDDDDEDEDEDRYGNASDSDESVASDVRSPRLAASATLADTGAEGAASKATVRDEDEDASPSPASQPAAERMSIASMM
ncbi:uncharacterized protein PSFLO_04858 [Pseudozyma flocculosa]|nr:uncharacterized protein PSFLO_04858 [Pseudozyma flocculosa]